MFCVQVASDCGTVLMMDWLFHVDTTEEEAKACALSVRQFLGNILFVFVDEYSN